MLLLKEIIMRHFAATNIVSW